MQRGNGLHQLMDALVRVETSAVEHDEILVGKAELRAQRFGCRAGAEAGRVNAVVQNVGPLRVKGTGLQVILADKIAQRQHAAVDVVHHGVQVVWPCRCARQRLRPNMRLMALHWVRFPPSATIRSGGGSSSASESWTFWYHGS